jgi:Homocysteine S-methyltransferase
MDHVARSARANLEQPDVVQRVHEEYIRAGAEVIIANTYASSRAALEPAGLGSRVADANRSAIRAAPAGPRGATGPVAVAGSVGRARAHPSALRRAAPPRHPNPAGNLAHCQAARTGRAGVSPSAETSKNASGSDLSGYSRTDPNR